MFGPVPTKIRVHTFSLQNMWGSILQITLLAHILVPSKQIKLDDHVLHRLIFYNCNFVTKITNQTFLWLFTAFWPKPFSPCFSSFSFISSADFYLINAYIFFKVLLEDLWWSQPPIRTFTLAVNFTNLFSIVCWISDGVFWRFLFLIFYTSAHSLYYVIAPRHKPAVRLTQLWAWRDRSKAYFIVLPANPYKLLFAAEQPWAMSHDLQTLHCEALYQAEQPPYPFSCTFSVSFLLVWLAASLKSKTQCIMHQN